MLSFPTGDINKVVKTTTQTTALISYTANESANSFLDYGLNISYGNITQTTASSTNFSFTLSNLSSGATYNFRITARDPSNNTSQSINYTFATKPSVAPVIPPVEPSPTPPSGGGGGGGGGGSVSAPSGGGGGGGMSSASAPKINTSNNLSYADNTLIKATSSPKVYVIKNGKKIFIPNEAIFKSYNYSSDKIIAIGDDELSGYGEGGELKLAENSLIISDAGPRIYLIKDNKRYWMATDEIFNAYGLKRENVLKIDVSLVKSYEDAGELKISGTNQVIVLGAEYKPSFSYEKSRLGSLTEEQELAIVLREKLEKNYSKKQLQGINGKNWNTITNSYIYAAIRLKP